MQMATSAERASPCITVRAIPEFRTPRVLSTSKSLHVENVEVFPGARISSPSEVVEAGPLLARLGYRCRRTSRDSHVARCTQVRLEVCRSVKYRTVCSQPQYLAK